MLGKKEFQFKNKASVDAILETDDGLQCMAQLTRAHPSAIFDPPLNGNNENENCNNERNNGNHHKHNNKNSNDL